MSSIVVSGDTSGAITVSAPAVAGTNTLTLPAVTDTLTGIAATQTLTNKTLTSPTLTTPALGTPASGILTSCTGVNYDGYKNRIINGAMVIDQRNAGASVTPTNGQYTLDRWQANLTAASKYSVQQSSTTTTGFSKSLLVTSLSAYSVGSGDQFNILQKIEGFNIADLGFGAAGASPITLSFWVRSSLTGTFSGSINNGAFTRNYIFNYTISSANTWEYKTITIAGDTSGSWTTDNSAGLNIVFGLGSGSTYSGTAGSWGSTYYTQSTGSTSVVGTNGATFYITGVQLEKGSTATSFDYRDYGTELVLCQRYYEIGGLFFQSGGTPSSQGTSAYFSVSKRTTPTITFTNTAYNAGSGIANYTSGISGYNALGSFAYYFIPSGNGGFVTSNWSSSAEL